MLSKFCGYAAVPDPHLSFAVFLLYTVNCGNHYGKCSRKNVCQDALQLRPHIVDIFYSYLFYLKLNSKTITIFYIIRNINNLYALKITQENIPGGIYLINNNFLRVNAEKKTKFDK